MSSCLSIARIRRNFFIKFAAFVFVIGIVIILHSNNISSSSSDSHEARLSVNIAPTQSDDKGNQFRDDAPLGFDRRSSSVQTLDLQKKTAVPGHINNLTDVFISIKTTGKFHRSRVDLQIKTWFKLAKDQVKY
jgi:Fringe-like